MTKFDLIKSSKSAEEFVNTLESFGIDLRYAAVNYISCNDYQNFGFCANQLNCTNCIKYRSTQYFQALNSTINGRYFDLLIQHMSNVDDFLQKLQEINELIYVNLSESFKQCDNWKTSGECKSFNNCEECRIHRARLFLQQDV